MHNMKAPFKIITICVIVFLFLNLIGGLIIGWAGQTPKQILLGFLTFLVYGLVFGIILAVVDHLLPKKK